MPCSAARMRPTPHGQARICMLDTFRRHTQLRIAAPDHMPKSISRTATPADMPGMPAERRKRNAGYIQQSLQQ